MKTMAAAMVAAIITLTMMTGNAYAKGNKVHCLVSDNGKGELSALFAIKTPKPIVKAGWKYNCKK